MQKPFEHDFLQNSLKFYKKMDLSIRMRIIYNAKHRDAAPLKFGDKILTSLTKLVLEAKASVCSMIKEKLLLYFYIVYIVSVIVAII